MSHIENEQMQIVTPSAWLGDLSRKSAIFKRFEHKVIRNMNALEDTHINERWLREKYKLDENVTVFIFVAHHFDNPRKGIKVLLQALETMKERDIKLIAIGEKNSSMLKQRFNDGVWKILCHRWQNKSIG